MVPVPNHDITKNVTEFLHTQDSGNIVGLGDRAQTSQYRSILIQYHQVTTETNKGWTCDTYDVIYAEYAE